jgi:hypothetical protein
MFAQDRLRDNAVAMSLFCLERGIGIGGETRVVVMISTPLSLYS